MKFKRFYLPDVYLGFLILPVIGFIALISSFFLPMLASHGPTVVQTEGAEAESVTKTLTSLLTSVMRDGGKVRLHANTHYLDDGSGFVHDVTLGLGQGFSVPDKHAKHKFVLKSMTKDGIELTYDDCLDHRDFGKNLITEDRGIVEISWK